MPIEKRALGTNVRQSWPFLVCSFLDRSLTMRNGTFNCTLQLLHGRRARINSLTTSKHAGVSRRRPHRRRAAHSAAPHFGVPQIPGERMRAILSLPIPSNRCIAISWTIPHHQRPIRGRRSSHFRLFGREFLVKRLHLLHILPNNFFGR